MASDYALKLKATLDTSQVQQELKRLRAAQAQAAQEIGGTKGAPIGTAHMQKIEVQLTKLNSSISGLQRAVEQLQRTQAHTAHQANIPQHAGTFQYLPVGMKPSDMRRWMESSKYNSLNRRVNQLLMKQGNSLGRVVRYQGGLYRIGAASNAARLFSSGRLEQLDQSLAATYERQMDKFNKKTNTPQSRAERRQNRHIAAVIGGQLIGGAGDLATALGYNDIGRSLGNIGSGITGGASAAWSASMAGMSGSMVTGIGAVVGLATVIASNISSMEELAQAVQKTAKAFEENYASLHRQTRSIQESILGSRHQTRAEQLLESGNIDEAKKQAKYWSDAYKSAKDTFENVGDPGAEESRIRRLAEQKKAAVDAALKGSNLEWAESTLGETLFKIMGQPGAETRKGEVKNQIDEEAQKQIQEMQQRYKDMQAEMNKAKGFAETYQSVVDKLEGDREAEFKKSQIEVQRRLQLSERNDQAIASYKAQGEANRTQAFANDVLGDKMTSPLEKFNKIAEQLDAARAKRNEALTGAYGISKEIAGGKMTSEEMTRAMAKQSRLDTQAAEQQNLIGILENALANISTQAVTPDLSHMTSLAQYGFNMGEKDDTVERMDKYYTKSINLQQQIKDKLEEGIKTEATYN